MSVTRVVDERVLAPISVEKPAGEDLRALKEWVEIKKAKPNLSDTADKRDWQPANPVKTDWSTYKDLVEKALCTKSKDLELGVFLTESCARLHGFVGVRDGIWAVRGLISEFSDKGLFPGTGERQPRRPIRQAGMVQRQACGSDAGDSADPASAPAVNYSLNYRDEALRQNGMITAAEFESAVSAGKKEQYEALSQELEEARKEFEDLEQVANDKFGSGALSFANSRQVFDDCRTAVSSILRKKQGGAAKSGANGHGLVHSLDGGSRGSGRSFGGVVGRC